MEPLHTHLTLTFFNGTGEEAEEISTTYLTFRTRARLTTVTFYAAQLDDMKVREWRNGKLEQEDGVRWKVSRVACAGGPGRAVVKLSEDVGRETLTAHLDSPIPAGRTCRIRIRYRPRLHCGEVDQASSNPKSRLPTCRTTKWDCGVCGKGAICW